MDETTPFRPDLDLMSACQVAASVTVQVATT